VKRILDLLAEAQAQLMDELSKEERESGHDSSFDLIIAGRNLSDRQSFSPVEWKKISQLLAQVSSLVRDGHNYQQLRALLNLNPMRGAEILWGQPHVGKSSRTREILGDLELRHVPCPDYMRGEE
jgi:hypothetical protein